jgi:phosphomevalonate kinase
MGLESKIRIWCVPGSILCAWMYMVKEKRPVRITLSHTDNPSVDHAQAQVLNEDGEWIYLTDKCGWDCIEVELYGKQNCPDAHEPYRYVGLLDFIAEQVNALGLGDLANIK